MDHDISDRLLNFAAETIKFVPRLFKTAAGRYIGNQLMRAGSSAGANYEEACGAESRADFVHKMQIVLKELRESKFWLKLIERSLLIDPSDPGLRMLTKEAQELTNIIAKSVITAKTRAV